MTQEEKAKRYDEALTKARNIVNSINVGLIGKDSFEAVFPELKKNEDEKIRKRIIDALHGDVLEMSEIKEAIAWLEKQGPQKTTKIEVNAGELSDFERSLKHIIEEAIEDGDTHNLKADADMLLRIAHKSAWSEEDDRMKDSIIKDLIHPWYSKIPDSTKDEINWLKSLKDRVQPQPKQEWSALDERNLQGIIDEIEANKNQAPGYDLATYDRFISWLKSLRPQNRWKPSDTNTTSGTSNWPNYLKG